MSYLETSAVSFINIKEIFNLLMTEIIYNVNINHTNKIDDFEKEKINDVINYSNNQFESIDNYNTINNEHNINNSANFKEL